MMNATMMDTLTLTANDNSKVVKAENFSYNPHSSSSSSQKTKQVLGEFQGMLVNIMMSSMRKTVEKNDMFNGGAGEEIFQGMLDTEYSKEAGKSDMFRLENVLRRINRLPVNGVFKWEKMESIPPEVHEEIIADLGALDSRLVSTFRANEDSSARVTKILNHYSKKRNLEEFIPEGKLQKLDPEELNDWKKMKEAYMEEKGIAGRAGNEMKRLNKDLLEKVYPGLAAQQNKTSKTQNEKAFQAYNKIATE